MALIQMDFMSNALQRFTSAMVLLPADGYKQTQPGPFPTLYLLHGYEGNYTDWVCNTRIAIWAQQRGLAVVMPSGENAFYLDYPERAERFQTFLGEELIELTRKAFPLSSRREDTYIGGLSMGGGGAIRTGLRYAHVFSKAAGLSAGLTLHAEAQRLEHGADMFEALEEARSACNKLPALYLSIGTEDPLLKGNREFHAYLTEQGIDHVYEEHPGKHNWEYWDTHLPAMLDWLQKDGEE